MRKLVHIEVIANTGAQRILLTALAVDGTLWVGELQRRYGKDDENGDRGEYEGYEATWEQIATPPEGNWLRGREPSMQEVVERLREQGSRTLIGGKEL